MTQQAPAAGAAPQGLSLPEKVIQHIQLTDTALQKAAAFEKTAATKQAAYESKIPAVVAAMVQFERIAPNQKEKLAEMLKDPAQALDLMIKLAGHRNTEELARLGTGVGLDGQVKTAGARPQANPASSLTNPNVGARTTMVKQSEVNLFKGLGLPTPAAG